MEWLQKPPVSSRKLLSENLRQDRSENRAAQIPDTLTLSLKGAGTPLQSQDPRMLEDISFVAPVKQQQQCANGLGKDILLSLTVNFLVLDPILSKTCCLLFPFSPSYVRVYVFVSMWALMH